jgi:hypothetical protein
MPIDSLDWKLDLFDTYSSQLHVISTLSLFHKLWNLLQHALSLILNYVFTIPLVRASNGRRLFPFSEFPKCPRALITTILGSHTTATFSRRRTVHLNSLCHSRWMSSKLTPVQYIFHLIFFLARTARKHRSVTKSKSKSHYDRQWVGQSVLVSGSLLSHWDFLWDSYCLLCCSALSDAPLTILRCSDQAENTVPLFFHCCKLDCCSGYLAMSAVHRVFVQQRLVVRLSA